MSYKKGSLKTLYNFKTKKISYFNLGDLLDLKDNWGPGIIEEISLNEEVDEWSYIFYFPIVNKKVKYYETKIRYLILIKEAFIYKNKGNI